MFKVPLRNVYPKSILWISKIVLLNLQSNIFQNKKHNDDKKLHVVLKICFML